MFCINVSKDHLMGLNMLTILTGKGNINKVSGILKVAESILHIVLKIRPYCKQSFSAILDN